MGDGNPCYIDISGLVPVEYNGYGWDGVMVAGIKFGVFPPQ